MLTKDSRSILYPSPQSVQNSNTDQRQSEYPSFAFGTDGALRPCVLASPLGPKQFCTVLKGGVGPKQFCTVLKRGEWDQNSFAQFCNPKAIPPPLKVCKTQILTKDSQNILYLPLKVCKTQILTKDNQNILASPLGPMAHVVRVSQLRLWDRWRTSSMCPSFSFRTEIVLHSFEEGGLDHNSFAQF